MSTPLAIGIDFGGTSIKFAVVRGAEVVARGENIPTQNFTTTEESLLAIFAEIERLRSLYPEIAAIGAGLPGMVDADRGFVFELTNVKGWKSVPLRDLLEKETGLPVAVDNDARAMAYGEWRFGAAGKYPHVVCVTLGTGVGGGLILNGQLYRGSFNGAGEIGQTSINFEGPPAHYGNSGAIEKYVGNQQITERACAAYRARGIERPIEECTPAALSKAADEGCEVAIALWKQVGTEIGASLANLVWLLNPNCFVIGGGVAKAGPRLFDAIRSSIVARCMDVYVENLELIPAQLGSDAGAIGAAALALEHGQ